MKGSAGIVVLKLEVLNKLISLLPKRQTSYFAGILPTDNYPSDTVKWEVEYGSAGMTPFVAPGAPAPLVGIDGTGEGSASAAYFKEKMFFDESFLNNMREPGNSQKYLTAQKRLSNAVSKLDYRCERRRDWMTAKALIDGGFTYVKKGGQRFTVNYGVPSTHKLTLSADRKWTDGASRNPVEDIFDGKEILADDAGVTSITGVCTTNILKLLMFDTKIQELLKKSSFGEGDLFKNPQAVIGILLGVGPLAVVDDLYEITGWLTTNVTGGATTTFGIDDMTNMEAGGKLRLHDTSAVNVWEDLTIASVDINASTVTTTTAPVRSYKAKEDKVSMKKKFVPEDTFFLYSPTFEGMPIGEVLNAPFGNERNWGRYIDTKDEWDPDGIFVRVQDKALPVLYHPTTTYTIVVK